VEPDGLLMFNPRSIGPRNIPDKVVTPVQYFGLFITIDVLMHMVQQTNA
jgi:hypothetical protein